jgi:hypothetical protein
MEHLELHDSGTETAATYLLSVCATLLTMGVVQGIKPDDMVEFFASQVQTMLTAPPNYKLYGKTAPVWIMRGFYPKTPIFFKLTVCRNERGTYVKASIPMVKGGKKRTGYPSLIKFDGAQLNETITNKMENSFFGASHEVKPLVSWLRMPRCMSPRGVKIFSYEKPSKKNS